MIYAKDNGCITEVCKQEKIWIKIFLANKFVLAHISSCGYEGGYPQPGDENSGFEGIFVGSAVVEGRAGAF